MKNGNDIIEINGIGLLKPLLIHAINIADHAEAEVLPGIFVKFIDIAPAILGMADLGEHRFGRQTLFVDIQLLDAFRNDWHITAASG